MKRGGPLPRRTRLSANSPLRPGGKLPRSSRLERLEPINPKSAKRAAEDRRRSKVVDTLKATRGPDCQARVRGVCAGRHTDAHEVLRRSQGGSIVDPANILLVCRACHDWIGANPNEAVARGLSRWGIRRNPDRHDPRTAA